MSTRTYTPRYPTELRERGVRLVREHRSEYASDRAVYQAIAPKLGCSPDSWAMTAIASHGEVHRVLPGQYRHLGG